MSHLFWLSTFIPGFAVLQAFFPCDIRRGILGTLTWSFVLTVALTTPIVVIAHVLHLSVSTVGSLYLGLILMGLVGIVKFSHWPKLRRSLRISYWPEITLILCSIAVTVYFGGSAIDDSFVHAAKIRYLRDLGFSLQDPYSPLAVMETRHHVNTQHALFAIASWISDEEPLELWFKSAWFFRLIALGGVGYLAATMFRSRWIGTVTMVAALGVIGSLKAIVYPYAITAYVVLPLLLAQIVDLLVRPTRRGYLRILLLSLSLSVLHVGYWLIAAMCLLPPLCIWGLWQYREKPLWRVGVLTVAALFPGIPFLLITAMSPNHVDAQQGVEHLWMLRVIDFAHGWKFSILDPSHYAWMLPTVAATALLLAMRKQCRVQQIFLAAVFFTSMFYMFTPILSGALAKIIPYWLIERGRFIGEVIAYVNIAGGLAWISRRALPTRASRVGFALTVFCAGIVVFRVSVKEYFEYRKVHWLWLQQARELQETVHSVPDRALVAADAEWSLVLPAVHHASVMAPKLFNANPADENLLQRHNDRQELFAPETSTDRRRQIISKHAINFILIKDNPGSYNGRRFDEIGDVVSSEHGFKLFKVRR